MTDSTIILPPEGRRTVRGGAFIPPLLILPLIIYNIAAFTGFRAAGAVGWTGESLRVPTVTAHTIALSWGDLLLVFALACLFVEVIKSTRVGRTSVIEHMLSMVVFVIFLVEFLVVGEAAAPVFLILTLMALFDVVAGFTISITGAGRDVTMG